MRFLALDIGRRRTGVCFCDDSNGVPVALTTIEHTTDEELIEAIRTFVRERKIDRLVAGLPLLLSGEEGEQTAYVRSITARLPEYRWYFVDERFSTPKHSPTDGDTAAACELMRIFLQRSAKTGY